MQKIRKIFNKINSISINFIRKAYNTCYYCFGRKDKFIILRSWFIQWGNSVVSRNFGDDLNFFLISALSGKKVVAISNIFHSKVLKSIMCVGSILEYSNKYTIVWGSGAMYGDANKFQQRPLEVCAVRGPLSRKYLQSLNIPCPAVYGDPALLLPKIYKPHYVDKKWKVGIIPHISDLNNSIINSFQKKEEGVVIIKLNKYDIWTDVIDEIVACDVILSSSLHGLIISDAYCVPNVWIKLSDKVEGNGFKFKDYFLSVNRNTEGPVTINTINDLIEAIRLGDNYRQIVWDYKPLLESCPFVIKKDII